MMKPLCRSAIFLWIAIASIGAGFAATDEPVAIFFVRHAEKANDDPRDPVLSPAGEERAIDLARLLAHAEVTHLYASQFKRTQQTLAPLAAQAKIEVVTLQAQEPQAQLDALRALPGGAVAVVAGHSNTIPHLVCELGGRAADLDCSESGRQLGDSVYDRVYLVVLPALQHRSDQAAETLSLRYGDGAP